MRDHPIAETSTWQQTDIHASGGIRTHNASKRTVADPGLTNARPPYRPVPLCCVWVMLVMKSRQHTCLLLFVFHFNKLSWWRFSFSNIEDITVTRYELRSMSTNARRPYVSEHFYFFYFILGFYFFFFPPSVTLSWQTSWVFKLLRRLLFRLFTLFYIHVTVHRNRFLFK